MTLKRIAVGVSYDGHRYSGWQMQNGDVPTLEAQLTRALGSVANHHVSLTCAGRTDAGVHATAQVVHFDTTVEREDYSWVFGANRDLPGDIRVQWARVVPFEFHARFSAMRRVYRYVLYNHRIRPAILSHAVGWYYKPLDVTLMQEASECLLGEHDFSSFRAAACQASHPTRTVSRVLWERHGDMVVFTIEANAFLMHMVRNIVGTVLKVGAGEQPVEAVHEILAARDRQVAGITFGAQGLYLISVMYPEEYGLESQSEGPFFLAPVLVS